MKKQSSGNNGQTTSSTTHIADFTGSLRNSQIAGRDIVVINIQSLSGLSVVSPEAVAAVTNESIPDNPYRGLFAFRPEHAHLFFGRQSFTQKLVRAVESRHLVTVLGASGSGKSSVVFAGLVPALGASGGWRFTTFRLGGDPFLGLASALVPLYETDLSKTRQMIAIRGLVPSLRSGELPLADLLHLIRQAQPDHRIMMIVDQFEELYTLCRDVETRQRFLDLLLTAIQANQSPLTIVLTLRADFLSQASLYRPLADALQGTTELLGPMNRAEMTEAIEQPAVRQGVRFEAKLVERLMDDVGEEEGSLPLLEFALTELWQHQQRHTLTHAAYEEIGQVKGALSRHADKVFRHLSPPEQEQARRVFVQLVSPGLGTEDTRRLAPRPELETDWPLVTTLASERLVVTNQVEDEPETVEVVHEALIRHWQQLRFWMDMDRTFRAWQERLRINLQQWQASERDAGALLRGAPLAEARGWLAERPADLSQAEQTYIQASIELREQEAVEREAQRQRELEAAHKLTEEAEARRQAETKRAEEQAQHAASLRRRAIGLAGIGLVAVLLAVVASLFWVQATDNANKAKTEAARANAESTRALQNAAIAEAAGATANAESTRALENAATAQAASTLAVSNEATAMAERTEAERQRRIALARSLAGLASQTNNDNELTALLGVEAYQLDRDVDGHTDWLIDNVLRGVLSAPFFNTTLRQSYGIEAVNYSSNGRFLASGSADGTIWLYNLAKPDTEPHILRGSQSTISSVVFSPDSLILASGGYDGSIRLWNLAELGTEPNILRGSEGRISSITFSPDGLTLASGSEDGTVRLWSLNNLILEPQVLLQHETSIMSVVYSPDGHTLVAGSNDGTIWLWDLTNSTSEPSVLHQLGGVLSVTFSPDGQTLASSSGAGTIQLWDLSDPTAEPRVLRGHENWVNSVAFSPNGQILASGSRDGTIRLWNLAELTAEPHVLRGHVNYVQAIAFSPDGQTLASASADHTIRLWNLANPLTPTEVPSSYDKAVRSVDFSPDGRSLASGSVDGIIRLWSLTELVKEPQVLSTSVYLNSITFSPDSQTLASGSADGIIRLWDMNELSAEPRMLNSQGDHIYSIAFNPDGNILASGSGKGAIRLWDMNELSAEPQVLHGHQGDVRCIVFSPDGKTLASVSDDGIRLWDMNKLGAEPRVLRNQGDFVYSIAFSSNNQTFASGAFNGIVRLWMVPLLSVVE